MLLVDVDMDSSVHSLTSFPLRLENVIIFVYYYNIIKFGCKGKCDMVLRKDGYYYNKHSCFLLQYHLVLVTKYRHPVIKGDLESYLYNYAKNYFEKQGCVIQETNGEEDHIHIIFDAPPQINLASFINAFKSASSRVVRKQFLKELEPYYWKPYFWSLSYFVACVSDRSTELVRRYIRNQKGK